MQPSTSDLATPIYLESIRTDPWINLSESAPVHWTASTKSGSMQLHFFRCALLSDKQPQVGDLVGYFYSEGGHVEWNSDFAFTTAKGGYVEFRYVAMGGSQPSRVRRLAQRVGHFSKRLMRILVPLPHPRLLRNVHFLEGAAEAATALGSVSSAIFAGGLVALFVTYFRTWAGDRQWPTVVILSVDLTVATYAIIQEVRFIRQWHRMINRGLAAYKAKLGQT